MIQLLIDFICMEKYAINHFKFGLLYCRRKLWVLNYWEVLLVNFWLNERMDILWVEFYAVFYIFEGLAKVLKLIYCFLELDFILIISEKLNQFRVLLIHSKLLMNVFTFWGLSKFQVLPRSTLFYLNIGSMIVLVLTDQPISYISWESIPR